MLDVGWMVINYCLIFWKVLSVTFFYLLLPLCHKNVSGGTLQIRLFYQCQWFLKYKLNKYNFVSTCTTCVKSCVVCDPYCSSSRWDLHYTPACFFFQVLRGGKKKVTFSPLRLKSWPPF